MKILLKVSEMVWGGNTEYLINSDGISISNISVGTIKSTNYLSNRSYQLLISVKKYRFDYMSDVVSGVLKLDGSIQDNISLSELDPDFKRTRSINSEKLSYTFTEDFLSENDLLDKELYFYLSVQEKDL